MRKTITLTLFLLLAVWAVAQDTTPGAPPANSQSQTQSQPATPGQSSTTATPDQSQSQTPATSTTPDQSQTQSQTPGATDQGAQGMANAQVVEGCLGGKDPNYTVTAKDGTVYNLIVPQGADISTLAKHTGESVAVMGSVDTSSSSSSSASTGSVAGSENSKSSSSTTKDLHAMRIRKGTGTCPASGTSNPSGSSTTTPPPSPKK